MRFLFFTALFAAAASAQSNDDILIIMNPEVSLGPVTHNPPGKAADPSQVRFESVEVERSKTRVGGPQVTSITVRFGDGSGNE